MFSSCAWFVKWQHGLDKSSTKDLHILGWRSFASFLLIAWRQTPEALSFHFEVTSLALWADKLTMVPNIYMMLALVVNPFCIQSLRISNDWESQETNGKPTEVQKPMIPTYEDTDLTPPNHTKPMYSGSLWWAFLRSTQTCIFAQHLLSEWVLLSDALSYQPQPPRKNNSHVILEVLGKQQAPNTTVSIVSIVRNTTVVKSNKGQEQNQNPGRSPFLVVLEVCAFLLYGCKKMQKQLNPVRSKQSATTCQAWWFSYGLW